jgi:hypothetical protein
MKLKLPDSLLAQAKRLLHLQPNQLDRIGLLIRHHACEAAEHCAFLSRKTDLRYHKALKEFLAFFSAVAVNEIALREGSRGQSALESIYASLKRAICEAAETNPALLAHQLTVRRLLSAKRSGFDHWFYGYWNADFEGMQVSALERESLETSGVGGPTGEGSTDARLILVVRLARLAPAPTDQPFGPILKEFDESAREELRRFSEGLKRVLR